MDSESAVPSLDLMNAARERLRGLVDRRPGSATRGCADREHWCYGFSRSVAGPTFQSAALFGAVGPVEPWARDCLERWVAYQHPDGSVAEWFEGERSFCATAHTAFHALEAVLLLDPGLSAPWAKQVAGACARAAGWLSRQPVPADANQVAAAAALFARLAVVAGASAARRWLVRAVAHLEGLRSPEGWFAERGGFDPGYSSLTLSALARAWDATGWEKLHGWCRELEGVLVGLLPRLEPSPWEAWSRETAFLLPLFSAQGLDLWTCTAHGRWLGWDDRYLCFFAAPSLALTALRQARGRAAEPGGCVVSRIPSGEVGGVVWPQAAGGRLVLGLSKGGTVRAQDAGGARLDLGYALAEKGRVFTTLGPSRWWKSSAGREGPRVLVPFRLVRGGLPLGRAGPLIPAAARWLVRGPWAAPLTRWARRLGARRAEKADLWLERHFRFAPHGVIVEDRLGGVLGGLGSVMLCRSGGGAFAPASCQGPAAGGERWCREGLDASDARALLAGKPVTWRVEL